MKFCPHCGKQLSVPDSKFCSECGASLSSSEVSQATSVATIYANSSSVKARTSGDEDYETSPVKLNVYGLGIKLEETTAAIFEKMGYAVQRRQKPLTQSEATAEIDLVLTRGNRKKAVECKNYDPSRSIGVSLLRVFKDKLADAGFASGVFVTNTYFSEDAGKLAESTGIELWDGDKLREKFFAYALGRIRNPSMINDPILPLQQDYFAVSALTLRNPNAIKLFSSILFYHPYIVAKYRLQSIRNDPTGKRHTVTDGGTYIVDALDGDIINKEPTLFDSITGGFLKSKEKRMESREDKIVTEDLISVNAVSQTVMQTTDYDVTVAEPAVTEEDAVKLVKALVTEKNTQKVNYNIKIRGEWETRSIRVVPKLKEVTIRGEKLIYVPKWDLQYESGQRSFEKRTIASSGRILTDSLEKCEACTFMKKTPIAVCETCGLLLCEKHAVQEGRWVCKDHISDSMREEMKGTGFLSRLGIK